MGGVAVKTIVGLEKTVIVVVYLGVPPLVSLTSTRYVLGVLKVVESKGFAVVV